MQVRTGDRMTTTPAEQATAAPGRRRVDTNDDLPADALVLPPVLNVRPYPRKAGR